MIRQYELVDRVRKYNPHTDEALLNRAYVYAMQAHGGQTRASGDPYFSHPLEVAAILTEFRLDDASIVAALLHDTIEDTGTTKDEVDRLFGPKIGALVEGLTKLKKLDLVSKQAAQAENLRKLLLAISEDVRVLMVKLADRLHNMRTLHWVPEAKRARISEETLDIYAPLAGRMGMQEMREELEALAFRHLHPDAYKTIVDRLGVLRERSSDLIARIETELSGKLCDFGIEAQIKGREKRPYSIWRKMESKELAFEQLSDVFAFRVIVPTVADCYRALGIVHTTWPMVPGRFKDYVSTPKQNDYRSLHTTVIGPGHQRAELQIRTADMDQVAEYGIAAHTLYKDGVHGDADSRLSRDSRAYEWLRRTIEVIAEGDSPEEFLEHTKLELFQDQVFCFTPKGRLIAMPRGATPIDFAYEVHTRVGNSCVGCKINGRTAPLVSELQNGDEVEIIRADTQQPPAAWESLVRTGKARAAIRRATREAVHRQYAGLGRQIVERAFERVGKPYSDELLKAALPRLARNSVDEVMSEVGRGEMLSNDVVRAVYSEVKVDRPALRQAGHVSGSQAVKHGSTLRELSNVSADGTPSIPILGIKPHLSVHFAPDGGAVPGDRIVGIAEPGKGVTIYPIQSPVLADFEDQPDRWIDVRWDIEAAAALRFPARLKVACMNEPGSLAHITGAIARHDGNIDDISLIARSSDFHEVTLDLGVHDLKHLMDIMRDLKSSTVISSVERVNG
ncbi:bifunctional (p)ppGpp synthetase/guanosine-3',5'-bis(diphosphate) 3'-pyrophosphohydrolase [Terrihabitans rhizophilus]|jgi:GTP pyrophosphokinase|uniref:GTP pyrophosphokinase rsh n=1 Tax=Terrihabitans rhizophilus TaxID=3092662 RepID=A0ABU4RPW7_9HYPH|nr:bifunctional (p)ppGpp synthetase/guanosine-3',5'-bis(diphosphate) 3'-pyrophosphohydrolase [Terrihabitans sp. PJ23]MDX6806651.1 bifunctional (p)ppGpp synthetase/guanosine-3',5'-bis(diphosphate) 3'-pyrophosphohydrolase [Terrihabitans sp. PJ23]